MDCSIGSSSILFCSISKGTQIIYSHCLDRDLEALATAVLQTAPPLHSRYSHTTGNRTFAFLFDDDGHIYFAIADSSACAPLRFLELMRDGYHASKNSVHEELIPVVRRLIASLETISQPPQPAGELSSMITMAEAPLLTRRGGDEEGEGGAGEMWIDMNVKPACSVTLPKSLSARVRMQQTGRRLWWRHVKIVIMIDVVVCLMLFGIWLVVCRGFQCIA